MGSTFLTVLHFGSAAAIVLITHQCFGYHWAAPVPCQGSLFLLTHTVLMANRLRIGKRLEGVGWNSWPGLVEGIISCYPLSSLAIKTGAEAFLLLFTRLLLFRDKLGQLSACGKWWANSLCFPCVISPPSPNLPSSVIPFLSQTMNLLTFILLIFALCPNSLGWKRHWATLSAWLLYSVNLQQVIQKTHARLLYYTLLGFWCKTCCQYSVSARFHHFYTYLYGTLNPSS